MVSSNPNSIDIIDYIKQKWGVKEAKAAIKVAKCESGLRHNAKNSESSAMGVFQIIDGTWRSYRKLMGKDQSLELKENWIENIDTAYEIWFRSGWSQWVCKP